MKIEALHNNNHFNELNHYSKKLKCIFTLLCDQDLPKRMATLEHLSQYMFPIPEACLEDVKAELQSVNIQINHLLNSKTAADDNS